MNDVNPTSDIHIASTNVVAPPLLILEEIPISEAATNVVNETRSQIQDILHGRDDRLLVIAGPCSIHDPEAAIEYAERLLKLKQQYEKELLIVMRVYFEKPRTTVGWKGLINDPELNGSFQINKGLRTARKLLLELNEMGVPAGTEFLDLITPQYYADLISWGAIGARTTESQVHRELASGLSCPVGFKNATDGSVKVAIDAVGAASRPHHFLSIRKSGNSAIFETTGNPDCHIILRGGKQPNYDEDSVGEAAAALDNAGLKPSVMIDFSHANSSKQHKKQIDVSHNVSEQLSQGSNKVFGIMIESHLVEGNQKVVEGQALTYGQSITDACMNWDDSAMVIEELSKAVEKRRQA